MRSDLVAQARALGLTDELINRLNNHSLRAEIDSRVKDIEYETMRQKEAEAAAAKRKMRKELKKTESNRSHNKQEPRPITPVQKSVKTPAQPNDPSTSQPLQHPPALATSVWHKQPPVAEPRLLPQGTLASPDTSQQQGVSPSPSQQPVSESSVKKPGSGVTESQTTNAKSSEATDTEKCKNDGHDKVMDDFLADDVDSDTETLIDMSHVTCTVNPSDQKFVRFQFLLKARAEFSNSLMKNKQIVEETKKSLDNDDVELLNECLEGDNECLTQINLELRSIYVWAEERLAEKQAFYNDLCKQLVGPNATKARQHFADKVANMRQYVAIMKKNC